MPDNDPSRLFSVVPLKITQRSATEQYIKVNSNLPHPYDKMTDFLMPKTGLLISRDVFFASKVTGTAQALGLSIRCIGPDAFHEALKSADIGLVILDLDCPGVMPAEFIASRSPAEGISWIAFGPHIHAEKLEGAKAAGFHDVMPRSKFSANLPEILSAALSSQEK